jgi:ubiquitin-like domain-containing CTD phosphatase 1
LSFIWKKFDHFNSKNTVHIDDLSRNFVLNPKNGIPVKAFKQAQQTRHEDDELIHLKEYLMKVLIHTDDVTKVKPF